MYLPAALIFAVRMRTVIGSDSSPDVTATVTLAEPAPSLTT